MGTVSGPPVTMANVRSVFGGSAGTPLHAYVRGGSYVPDIPANSGVPTSVPITLHQLAGAQTAPVSASASPSAVSGVRSRPGFAQTNSVTATISGATATGYSWVRVSGDTSTVASANTSATTTFGATVSATQPSKTSVWKCTISYSGGSVDTNTVSADLEYISQ